MVDLPSIAPPAPALTPRERLRAIWSMWMVDHGFIRDIYCNIHRLSDKAWRSAQPAPRHLRWAKDRGIRTVVNLRGQRPTCGAYILERQATERLGLIQVDFPIRSRGALDKATIAAAQDLFPKLEYPVLFHCKSGADRAGFMSTLYLHLHEGVPIEKAMEQLSLRYGHVKQARTGVIDHFFGTYAREAAGKGIPFREWLETSYDAKALEAEFREKGWARLLVDSVLRRE